MTSKKVTIFNIFFILMILGLLVLSSLVFKLFIDQYSLKAELNQKEYSIEPIKKEAIEKIIVKVDSWAEIQPKIKDTVIQVFSQVADFNWLEPYKSPNQSLHAGSGFFIDDKGHFITNAHVVNQAKAVSIQVPSLGKEQFDANIVGICFDRDLALCKLKDDELQKLNVSLSNKIPFLTFGDSNKLVRGNEVMVLGYPLGQQSLKSTLGIVSGRQSIAGWHRQLVQIDAAINPGNSGGPVMNINGEVVGIATGGIELAQNVGYIIPVNELKIVLNDLHETPGKLLRKPILGIFYNAGNQALTKFLGNPVPGGCYVTSVYEGSLLDKVGIKAGDMIYEINGVSVDMFGDVSLKDCEDKISLIDYVSFITLNSEVKLTVYRNGKKKEFKFIFKQSKLPPIRIMHPDYEKIDYEIIGGMVVMQLTRNHLPYLITLAPELIFYEEPKNQTEPVLVVTHIHPDSQAQRSRVIIPGSRLKEVNGTEVKTLQDFRNAIKESSKNGFLSLKFYNEIFTAFPIKKILEDEGRLPYIYKYPVTPFMQEFIKEFISKDEKETRSEIAGVTAKA